MTYLTIARIPGDPQSLLDGYQQTAETMSGVGRDHGLIFHAAGKTREGLLIVNLWPSRANSQAAAEDGRRRDVIRQHERDPGRIRYEHHEMAEHALLGYGVA